MFQFSRFPPYTYVFSIRSCSFLHEVPPFGNLRIDGYLLLPAAFRSLSRLSSALSAKASTLRSFLLDLNLISIALETLVLRLLNAWFVLQTFVWYFRFVISRMSWLRYLSYSKSLSSFTFDRLSPSVATFSLFVFQIKFIWVVWMSDYRPYYI